VGIESPVHLLFIAVVALVVLGPKRLPGLARALGQGIREFRQSLDLGAGGEAQPPPAASETSAPHASSATPSPAPPPQAADSTPAPAAQPHAGDTTPAPPPQSRG
jgi:TatA/E family protein of Tat protein translocase